MDDIFIKEILSQPRVLHTILDHYTSDLSPPHKLARPKKKHNLILLTSMGSSYFALHPACIHLNEHGVPGLCVRNL